MRPLRRGFTLSIAATVIVPLGADSTAGALRADLDRAGRNRWAAVEWWWGAPDQAGWEDHFERTLRFRDCRFIAVYNWDCGFRFDRGKAGQDAVRALVTRWRN